MIVVIAATLVNAGCNRAGFYERFESADFDKLHLTAEGRKDSSSGQDCEPNTIQPRPQCVSVVVIDDDMFEDRLTFAKTIPLKGSALAHIVKSICDFHPRLVGVDIFSSDWLPLERMSALEQLKSCPIVWARDAVTTEQDKLYRLGRVLGSQGPPPNVCSGYPALVEDKDGVVRRYRRFVEATAGRGTVPAPYPTLISALRLKKSEDCDSFQSEKTETEPQKIRFSENDSILRINAAAFQPAAAPELKKLIENHVIILGGIYRYGGDVHMTPIGLLHGVEIVANAVASETIQDLHPFLVSSYEFFTEAALLAIVLRLNLRLLWRLLTSSVLCVIAAFFLSWVLFNYGGYFIGVFASISGVVLGVLAEVVWDPLTKDLKEWREGLGGVWKSA